MFNLPQIGLEVFVLIFFPCSLYFAFLFYTQFKFRRIRAAEFRESILEGATEEPHPTRPLSTNEVSLLKRKIDLIKPVKDNFLYQIGIVLLVTLLSTLVFMEWVLEGDFFQNLTMNEKIIGAVTAGIICGIAIVKASILSETRLYHDLNLPIWSVQGAFLPTWAPETRSKQSIFTFTVRNQRFALYEEKDPYLQIHNHELIKKLHEILEKTEVVVEYSPFSKVVWSVEPTQNF